MKAEINRRNKEEESQKWHCNGGGQGRGNLRKGERRKILQRDLFP